MTAVNKAMQKELAGSMADMASNMEDAFSFDSAAFAEAITVNMSEEDLAELMTAMMSKEATSYEGNLSKLGYSSLIIRR